MSDIRMGIAAEQISRTRFKVCVRPSTTLLHYKRTRLEEVLRGVVRKFSQFINMQSAIV